jgi:hypothetical protein
MTKKEKLVKKLKNAIHLEEENTEIIIEILKKKSSYLNLPNENAERLRWILDKIESDSRRHKVMFEEMVRYVERENKNVF